MPDMSKPEIAAMLKAQRNFAVRTAIEARQLRRRLRISALKLWRKRAND